jgi:predicted Fe-Mo cluster-binding NifX family protein
MILQIPVDINNYEEAVITAFRERKFWLIVELENGHTINSKFHNDMSEIKEMIDFIVLKNKEEDVEKFMDEGIVVLIAPLQKYVEDVVEAYMFRELHEL